MPKLLPRRGIATRGWLAAAAATSCVISGCARPNPAPIRVENAWVRLPAVPGAPAAAYFTLQGGAAPALLRAITSPKVQRIELHESMMQGGVMRMNPIVGFRLPKETVVRFEPEGRHAMLFGLAPAIKAGDTLPLRFRFEPPTTIVVVAKVVGPGDPAPGG